MSQHYDYIAIDIAKDTLQVQTRSENQALGYDYEGIERILSLAKEQEGALVVLEASGGYERRLIDALMDEAIPFALVNPRRIRGFAASEGVRAKTDPIDAKLIWRFAQEKKLQPSHIPQGNRAELAELLDRRGQLSGQLAREKNRRQKSSQRLLPLIETMIKTIQQQIAQIDKRMEELVESDQRLKWQSARMQSVTGVGPITAWTLLAYIGEIEQLSRNKLVALAGVAPFNRTSGLYEGKRTIQAGRAKVRRCLYMAARTAAIHNRVINPYVARLVKRGKPYRCAIVAAMRKLLIHIQSLIKKHDNALA